MIPFNPMLILAAIIFVGVLCGGSYEAGHKNGINAQKVADQQVIDKINAQIAANKVKANAALRESMQDVIAMERANDALKGTLAKEKSDHAQVNDRLANQLYVTGLRFAAENNRSGRSGENGMPKTDSAGNAETTCKLSATASGNLIAIVKDCDALADDYRELYGWAHR